MPKESLQHLLPEEARTSVVALPEASIKHGMGAAFALGFGMAGAIAGLTGAPKSWYLILPLVYLGIILSRRLYLGPREDKILREWSPDGPPGCGRD